MTDGYTLEVKLTARQIAIVAIGLRALADDLPKWNVEADDVEARVEDKCPMPSPYTKRPIELAELPPLINALVSADVEYHKNLAKRPWKQS